MASGSRQEPFVEERSRSHGQRSWDPGEAPSGRRASPDLPPITVGEALSRRWRLILLLTILGVAAGAALGYARPPTYTSESELNVGSLDAQAQAIPGYAQAAQTLAEAYARIVMTTQIEARAAKSTGASLDQVSANLTAANIPGNPIFRIDGTGSSARDAQSLTTAATQQMIAYARARTLPPGARSALNAYKQQTALASQASSRVGKLRALFGPAPTARQQAEITLAQQDAASANLQANAEQQLYITAIANGTSAGSVTLLTPAGTATNDRKQSIEIGGFGGAVVGAVLGCVIALQIAGRRRRQLMRALTSNS
jgi:uncharacterized protein involved in exopolysaccharide biosynthesis